MMIAMLRPGKVGAVPRRTGRRGVVLVAAALLSGGCSATAPEPSTQPVTAVDPRLAEPSYWYAQAATSTVVASDFDALWSAADSAARSRFFPIDRRDPRLGLLTTEPVVSQQWFEPWRRDTLDADALADSSLATIRRTIRFEFERRDDGSYAVSPKVLIERYSVAENRITSVVLYRSAFKLGRTTEQTPYGTRESDRGIYLPSRYWYAVGRDGALEQALAGDIQRRLGSAVAVAATTRASDAPTQ
jgi:hypothetical protein